MSSKAITWAFTLKGLSSSVKFVLVALADNADAADRAWPSVKTIIEKTNLNEKTVWKALDTLEELGFISDSGFRKGKTNQVKIYQLNTEKTEADIQSEHLQKRNTLESKTPPKTEVLNTSKNGAVKHLQNWKTSKNGRPPIFPLKTSNFSVKDLQFFQETPPNLEDGTYIEPYIEPLVEPSNTRAREKRPKKNNFFLPDWIPKDSWSGFVEMRKARKRPLTDRARELIIRKLDDFKQRGFDIESVLDASTSNGWIDVYEPKPNRPQANHSVFDQTMQAAAEAKKLIFGEKTA